MISSCIITNSEWLYSLFIQNVINFSIFTRMCAPVLVSTTHLGCHCPPNSFGTPPTHLLALCHHPHILLNRFHIHFLQLALSKQACIRKISNFHSLVHWACTHTTHSTRPLLHHLGQLFVHTHAPLCTFCAMLHTFLCTLHTFSAPSVHLLHTLAPLSVLHFLGLS